MKDHLGKIGGSIATAIVLSATWFIYGLLVEAAEARAEDFVDALLQERVSEINAPVQDVKEQLEQTKIQLKGTRSQVDILQRALAQNTKLLELLIRQTAPNPN